MRVVVAGSKAEGWRCSREHPSCVILDIFFPDGPRGPHQTDARRLAHDPIIMVSSQSEVDEVVQAMKEGASDYVKKPFQGRSSLKMQMVFDVSRPSGARRAALQDQPEEEYNLLFGMSDRMSKVQAILDQWRHRHHRPDHRRERHRQGAGRQAITRRPTG